MVFTGAQAVHFHHVDVFVRVSRPRLQGRKSEPVLLNSFTVSHRWSWSGEVNLQVSKVSKMIQLSPDHSLVAGYQVDY